MTALSAYKIDISNFHIVALNGNVYATVNIKSCSVCIIQGNFDASKYEFTMTTSNITAAVTIPATASFTLSLSLH